MELKEYQTRTLAVFERWQNVTVQTWWVELGEGGLPKAGAGGGGYVIYRAWILKWTSPPSTAMF